MTLKIGLGNSLILDATINPDFGQVEADPAVLNLSTFETFYPERRPFFVEGMQILRFPTFGGDGAGPGMFYSRRIGRGIGPDEVDISDEERVESLPQHATILGAAKLSGRISRGLSIGVLEAVTRREHSSVRSATGDVRDLPLDPAIHYNVLRARQDVLEGSYVGGIFTSVARERKAPALTAGLDWDLRLADATHRLDGFLAFTRTTDPDRQRVDGGAGRMQLARVAAVHWLWSASVDFTTPRYDINDVGFFRRPNDYGGFATLTYKEDVPAAVVRSYHFRTSMHERWNFDRANLNRNLELDTKVVFTNYWEVDASGGVDLGRYDDRETRGNGLYQKPTSGRFSVEVETDDRDVVALGLQQRWGWDERAMHRYAIEAKVEYRPVSWMAWSMETEFERVRRQEAWVENVSIGDRSISLFGDRSTDLASFTLRGEVTFTRDLTLQLYGQVFVAKGRYASFRAMDAPGVFHPWDGALPQRDFREHELHTNVVLRWEYVPGSTLYLVWSQVREGSDGTIFRTIQDDLGAVFRTPPSHVLLLKVSYWWNL